MSETEAEFREEFRDALGDADFSVHNQMELVPALPNGAETRFEADDFSVSVAELATMLAEYQDFPYETITDLVDDVMEALEEEALI